MERDVVAAACRGRGLEVVAEGGSVVDLVRVCDEYEADVVITDIDLTDGGIDQQVARLASSGSRILVLVEGSDPDRGAEMLAAGASGLLTFDITPDVLADAVIDLTQGLVVIDPSVAATIVEQWRISRPDR